MYEAQSRPQKKSNIHFLINYICGMTHTANKLGVVPFQERWHTIKEIHCVLKLGQKIGFIVRGRAGDLHESKARPLSSRKSYITQAAKSNPG